MKGRGCKKIFHANRNDKKAGFAILTLDKTDFKTKPIKKDKEGHYIIIKGSIQEEEFTLINIYAPNIGAPKYIKQILIYRDFPGDAVVKCPPANPGDTSLSPGTGRSHMPRSN